MPGSSTPGERLSRDSAHAERGPGESQLHDEESTDRSASRRPGDGKPSPYKYRQAGNLLGKNVLTTNNRVRAIITAQDTQAMLLKRREFLCFPIRSSRFTR